VFCTGVIQAALALVAGLAQPQSGPVAARAEVAAALQRLADASAAERQAAERWLSVHLLAADLPAVAAAAGGTDPEALRRLEIALGSDERHFELAALLAADSHAHARRLGEAALQRQTASWMGEGALESASSLQVLRGIVDRAAPRFALVFERGDFARILDALVRVGGEELRPRAGSARIEVVLDPLLLGQTFQPAAVDGAPPPPQEGDLGALLFALASVQGLELEGFGFSGGPRTPTWVHLVGAAQAGKRDAAGLIADWARDLLDPREGRRRAGAARALATCGWGAPLAWLERRWLAGDGAALEGVLLAASRGRVVPSLATGARVRELLLEADRALTAGEPTGDALAELVMHALGALPAFAADGTDLRAALVEGYAGLDARRRALRLGALCDLGSAPAEFLARARGELGTETSGLSAAERLELCRLLAVARAGGTSALGGARGVFELALRRDLGATFVDWLQAAGLGLPREWRDAAQPAADLAPWPRLLIAEAWLDAGDMQAALAHLRALAAASWGGDAARVVERLAELGGGASGAALRAALAAEDERGAGRLALYAGALPRERHAGELERALSGAGGADALLALGPLAGDPASPACAQARAAILGLARPALGGDLEHARADAPWAVAFEHAWRARVAAGDDAGAESWRGELAALLTESAREDRARARAARRAPLWMGFAERSWPALGGNPPRPLAALESPLPGA
jgi:hypothetical protein